MNVAKEALLCHDGRMRRCRAIVCPALLLCLWPLGSSADSSGSTLTTVDKYPRQYVEEKCWSFIKVSERIFARYPNAEAGYGLNDDSEMRCLLENIPLYREKISECQRISVSLSRLAPVEVLDREYFKLNNTKRNLAARLPTFKARSEAVLAKERQALNYSARACSAPSPSAVKEDWGRAVQAAREAIENYRTLRNMFDWEKLKKQREDVARIDGDPCQTREECRSGICLLGVCN